MRRGLWLALVLLACLGIAAPLTPAVADTGARVIKERRVDARTLDLTIESPSLRELTPPKVRLLLPADPDALWGDPVAQEGIWRAHNPYDLAEQLAGIPVLLSCGNGQPGELDPPLTLPTDGEGRFLEMGQALSARLRSLGGTVTEDFYGNGTHAWPYWQRELHRSFPMLMQAIGA